MQVIERCCEALSTLTLRAGDGVGELRLSIWLVRQWLGTPVNLCLEEHDQLGWFRADDLAELTMAHDAYQHLLANRIRCS